MRVTDPPLAIQAVHKHGETLGHWLDVLERRAAQDDAAITLARRAALKLKLWERLFSATLLASAALAVAGLFRSGSLVGVVVAVCVAAPFLFVVGRGLTRATAAQQATPVVVQHIGSRLVLPMLVRLAPTIGRQTPIQLEVAAQVRAEVRLSAVLDDGMTLAVEILDREHAVDGSLLVDRQLIVTRTDRDGAVVVREQTANLRNLFPFVLDTSELPHRAWQRMVDVVIAFIDVVHPVVHRVAPVVVEVLPTSAMLVAGRLQGTASAGRWRRLLDEQSKALRRPADIVSVVVIAVAFLLGFVLSKVAALTVFAGAVGFVILWRQRPPRGQQHEHLLRPFIEHAIERWGDDVWLRVDCPLEAAGGRGFTTAALLQRLASAVQVDERPVLAVEVGHVDERGWQASLQIEIVDATFENRAVTSSSGKRKVHRRSTRLIRATAPTTAAVQARRVKLTSPTITGTAELLDAVTVGLAK